MIVETGIFNLFGNNQPERRIGFDISLLPLNLSDGRNIGDLPGLFLYKAPKKTENSRLADIFIVLFYVDNIEVSEEKMQTWADIMAETYYAARGSFTMGISSAIRKLSAFLEKDNSGQIFPSIFMNAIVLRDRSLMAAHAGPVHTTVISASNVRNFSNDVCLPIQLKDNDPSFFSADIHPEDIILLCPRVPNDWTNSAILEVAGDSPLNAIRFLLDRSGGNLQAAVIQLKSGKGNIVFRSRTNITANVQPEKTDIDEIPDKKKRSRDRADKNAYEPEELYIERPLIRKRRSSELLKDFQISPDPEPQETPAEDTPAEEAKESEEEITNSLTGEQELPGSEDLPYNFSEPPAGKKPKPAETSETGGNQSVPEAEPGPQEPPDDKKKPKKKEKRKFHFGRFLIILLCGLFIPVIVVAALFFVYSQRSQDQLHREYLSLGVTAAQKAIDESNPEVQESLWTETIGYVEQALEYGSSPAATDLRKQAVSELDRINGGISVVYNYANRNKLPQGLCLTEIASSGQYTYALDSTSGSVLRFVASGNGLSIDSGFTCGPGSYSALRNDDDAAEEDPKIKVGPLIDFIILPSGNPHSFALAAVDANANILYCSSFTENQAGQLAKPEHGRLDITAIAYANNAMYVLDAQSSLIWEYLYSNTDGFIYDPSNYYGSYSPYLSDIIDFTMYKEFSYFLRDNGTLMICDYTGYRPDCRSITKIEDPASSAQILLTNHKFKKIMLNNSPDNSIYIMDAKLQSVLNISAKANFIRYIVPNRSAEEISQYSDATGFGITGQNRLLWGYQNDLYIGNMP